MSATNRGSKRRENDAYYTPAWCVEAIMPHLPWSHRVLDPFCGDGALLAATGSSKRFGWDISSKACEQAQARGVSAVCRDTLNCLPAAWSLVVTNPPYKEALDAINACLRLTQPRGTAALLLRLNFLEGVSRKQFWLENPCDVYVLSKRPSFTGDGKTDATAYAFFVWGPGRGGRWWVI